MQAIFFSSISGTNPNSDIPLLFNLFPTSPQVKKYWCHLCKKEFSHIYDDSTDINCISCGKTFCEIIETDDITNQSHPIHFKPYNVCENENNASDNTSHNTSTTTNTIPNSIPSNINNDMNNNNIYNNENQNTIRNNVLRFLPSFFISHFMMRNNNDNFDNLLNQIMLNDTNKYGNPPASQKEIEKLKKCTINEEKIKEFGIENSCAVCKEEFTIGEECMLMPCNHHFHGDCLIPWLKERNSCPVCRYELATDDEDFELRKKKKLTNNINNIP